MKKGLGLIFILLSLPLLFHQQIKEEIYKNFNDKLLVAVSENQKNVEKSAIEKLYMNDSTNVKTSEVKAILSIPEIELKEPIFQGTTEEHLKNGVAVVEEDEDFTRNNLSIAGHKMNAYGVLFNRLHELEIGSQIEVKTSDKVKKYMVTERFTVAPNEVSILEETVEETITLITCESYNWNTYEFEERLVIRGEIMKDG
ncbi:class D sortase [Bacillus haikouensis]|uniref:class D sortase n=1 Tax=Bacillus haikouensis TaxID=1510468 RepID=UPI0015530F5C|nr:class D sortase [Bacillus haikouensis]NQD64875.1 class D sortase [Bacillus haikouensis]